MLDVFAGDDGVEEVTDLEVIEDFVDGVSRISREGTPPRL
jgi:hypothetical protein